MSWSGPGNQAAWGLLRIDSGPWATSHDQKQFNSRAGGPHAGHGNWMQSFSPRPYIQTRPSATPYNYVSNDMITREKFVAPIGSKIPGLNKIGMRGRAGRIAKGDKDTLRSMWGVSGSFHDYPKGNGETIVKAKDAPNKPPTLYETNKIVDNESTTASTTAPPTSPSLSIPESEPRQSGFGPSHRIHQTAPSRKLLGAPPALSVNTNLGSNTYGLKSSSSSPDDNIITKGARRTAVAAIKAPPTPTFPKSPITPTKYTMKKKQFKGGGPKASGADDVLREKRKVNTFGKSIKRSKAKLSKKK